MKLEEYLKQGYEVTGESDNYIFLEKQKRFNFGWFIFWSAISMLLGGIIYAIYYVGKQNKKVTVRK